MRILTIDVEDWFHILDNESTRYEKDWSTFESRIHRNMDIILAILEERNVRASFFVLGWIADKYPEVVREIHKRGFEIGSHTNMHQLVTSQSKEEFRQDVDRSIKALQDVIGYNVNMFRAPGFSITEDCKWAFEVLYDLGIKIDASIFPAGRSHGGMKSYSEAFPSILSYNGLEFKEFPLNTTSLFGFKVVYSGGGFFRITPYPILKKLTQNQEYVMSYLHPRDLDKDQPMIPGLSPLRKFKSYVGLKSAKTKLENWLTDFQFTDIGTADSQIDWKSVNKVMV